MVLNKNLVYFKILSVFMALLMAAFLVQQSIVRAEASISLGAIIDSYGIPIVLGLCIGTVIIAAMAVTGFTAKDVSVDKLGVMIKSFYQTYGESVCQSIYESVQDGTILVHTADPISGGFWLVTEWVKDYLELHTINNGGSVSGGTLGTIRSCYASQFDGTVISGLHRYTFRKDYETDYPLTGIDLTPYLNDFSGVFSQLRSASASMSSGALYISHIIPGYRDGFFGILCRKLNTFWSASVPASVPLYSYDVVLIKANSSNSSYSSLINGGLVDFSLCSTFGSTGQVYNVTYQSPGMFFIDNLYAVVNYWLANNVDFTTTSGGRVRGILSNNLFYCWPTATATSSYMGYGLPFQFFKLTSGSFGTTATSEDIYGYISEEATSGNRTYFSSGAFSTDGLQVPAEIKNSVTPFKAYVAEALSMTLEWVSAHPLTGEVQEEKLRDLAGNPGGIYVDLPTLNDTDTVWTIPSAGDIADEIAASPSEVVGAFARPLVAVFEQVAISIKTFPKFITPFLDIATNAFVNAVDASEDVYGIFKFWYDWEDAA